MKEKQVLLKPKEAAEMLGITTRTLFTWNKDKKIKCFRTVGNHKRISLSEVERLLSCEK